MTNAEKLEASIKAEVNQLQSRLQKLAADAEALERTKKMQQELEVALFDGDARVSDWTVFATGKIHLDGDWVKRNGFSLNTGPSLLLRTKTGAGVSSAEASVNEIITKTYTVTWRTMW